MRFIETSIFTRQVTAALADDEYRLLQEALLRNPAVGAVIAGTDGLRKLRWAESNRGKRGSLRIIYFWHIRRDVCLMLYMYRKNEQPDLTMEQRKVLARVVQEELK